MKEQLESKKDMNEYKIVIPMSDETIKKIKSNAAKAVLGASIAGVMIAGGQSVKAQSVQEPAAVVQTIDAQNENDKKELSLMIDEILTSKEKKTNDAEVKAANNVEEVNDAKEVTAETLSVNNSSSDEIQTEEAQAQELNAAKEQTEDTTQADEVGQVEEKTTLSLDDFINNEGIEALFDVDKIKADAAKNLDVDNLDLEEEKTPEVQKAGEDQKATEPNYAEDEKKIKDYSEEERYRSSDLPPETEDEQGNRIGGPSHTSGDPEMQPKDGFSYNTLEPSKTSEDKTQWGVEMEFDKEKSQRTYTDFNFTNSGLLGGVLDSENVSANEVGDKLAEGFKDPNYKADANIDITSSRQQRNLNLYATEEDLKYINNKDNKNTIIAWEGKYKKDPTEQDLRATQGSNASFSFTVNPWPNENDKLNIIKLNGSHDKKEFVQGQEITTNVQVENLDENARERLVGQVYNPLTGQVVEGAKAYINDQGKVVVKMPEGAVNADGTINKNSIFYKDPKFKGIQNLEVKFFARPRTADEFKAISDKVNYGGGHYTSTGAGTETIKHKGQDVVIDKQGIDRYDHYNLIGGFNINLDDTRYYDQEFANKTKDETSGDEKATEVKEDEFTDILPGKDFTVDMYIPSDKTIYQKTGEEMNAAQKAGEASGEIDTKFVVKKNEELAKKYDVSYEEFMENKAYEGKRWEIKKPENDVAQFIITAPENAEAGQYVTINVNYTYTNGSTDKKAYHFIVQKSYFINPEYEVKVNYPTEEQTSPSIVKAEEGREGPSSYSIKEGTEFKDDQGNEWTVTIDEKTGQVTAKPVDPKAFKGGEKLQVPVIAHYTDPKEPDKVITEETKAEFVIKEKTNTPPDYSAKVGKAGEELSSSATINKDEDDYNRTPNSYSLPDTVLTDKDGNRYVLDDNGYKWIVTINPETGEVKATVPYGEDVNYANLRGTIINVPVEAHYINENGDDAGTEETSVQFVATGEDLNHIQYDAKKGKAGDTLESDVILDQNEYERKPVKYTIDQTKYKDDKGNEWTVSIDSKTGKVTATVPNAAEGKTIHLDGAMITVPVTAHYEDDNGKEIGTKKANVQFLGSGTKGTHKVTEEIPFEVEVRKDPTLKKGEWKYAKDEDGNELIGENGEQETTLTIVDSKVTETSEPTVTKKPKKAVILIGEEDYTGTVTHTETIETPFEVEYRYSEELDAGETKVIQKGEKGSYDLEYSQKIKNGQTDGDAKTAKTKVVDAKKEIIVIGIKQVEKVVEKGYNTVYEYDENLEAGKIEEKTPGKNGKTTIKTSYDKENNKLVTEEKTEDPTDRVVKIGIKPIEKETELPFETEYVYDENIEAGKTEVTQEGEKGKAKITTSFNKETGKLETKVERKEPTKKIVKYGSKTEGEVKIEHEEKYEVEIIYDSEMKAGEKEVVQEGKNGKSETTITIKNSKEVSRETKLIEKAQKKIIKVGTKNVCEIPTPDPEEPEKPVDPDNPGITEEPDKPGQEEPGKPGEKDPEKPGTPGTPGTPDKPNTPGTPDTPSEGGTTSSEEKPSEDQKDSETKPETSVEEDKDPEFNEETSVEETEESVEKPEVEKENETTKTKQLPKTGDGMNRSLYAYAMGLMGSALLALGAKKKKNDTVDEK